MVALTPALGRIVRRAIGHRLEPDCAVLACRGSNPVSPTVMSQDIPDARTHGSWVRASVMSGWVRVAGRWAGSRGWGRWSARGGVRRWRRGWRRRAGAWGGGGGGWGGGGAGAGG